MTILAAAVGVLLVAAAAGNAALLLLRASDRRADRAETERLLALRPPMPALFDPAMLDDLPEPVQRYFRQAIRPGAPLHTVADIAMTGTFDMGTTGAPRAMDMAARQVLAFPHGFVWSMRARRGWLTLSGSDTARWTRFWLFGLIPVARLGGDDDHRRSAFGRYVAESVFWTPAAVLPSAAVRWQALGDNAIRATVTYGDLDQAVDLTLDEKGRAVRVVFSRWSNANPQRRYQLQPFGGYLSEHADCDGFCLPTRIEAGNMFGTPDYFPFFRIKARRLKFPAAIDAG